VCIFKSFKPKAKTISVLIFFICWAAFISPFSSSNNFASSRALSSNSDGSTTHLISYKGRSSGMNCSISSSSPYIFRLLWLSSNSISNCSLLLLFVSIMCENISYTLCVFSSLLCYRFDKFSNVYWLCYCHYISISIILLDSYLYYAYISWISFIS
jgi:hypothetical protein